MSGWGARQRAGAEVVGLDDDRVLLAGLRCASSGWDTRS
jgi:hypothetical protein